MLCCPKQSQPSQRRMRTSQEQLASAIEHHRAGRLAEAEKLYREMLGQTPTLPHPWYLLGMLANQVGQPTLAVELLDHALSLKPDFVDAIAERGTALVKLGRATEAIEHYQRAIGLKPDYAEAHLNLGNALLLERRAEEAVDHFLRALELKPEFADIH